MVLAALSADFSQAAAVNVRRGTVVEKLNNAEALIVMKKLPLAVGDKLYIYSVECPGNKGSDACIRKTLGKVEVAETRGNDRYLVKVPAGVNFEEGNFVRKVKR